MFRSIIFVASVRHNANLNLSQCELITLYLAVYKTGTGTLGRVCGYLWTRGEGRGDIKHGTRGRMGRGRRDVK